MTGSVRAGRYRPVGALLLLLTAGSAAIAQPALPSPSIPAGPAISQPDPSVRPPAFDPPAPARDAPTQPAAAGPDGVPLQDRWRNGLRFESADKAFSLFVGGRAQLDVADYITSRAVRESIPGTNPLEDGVTFRRIRLDMGGTIYKNVDFYTQVDFANGLILSPGAKGATGTTNATYPTDVWVTFRNLPTVGNVRVGNQKPLYSFEHMTSSRFLNFLERSPGFDAFSEGFNNGFMPGITAFDLYADRRGTWAIGLFKYTRNPFGWNVGRNEAEVNGRVTYLPVDEDDGRKLVHIGVGAAYRDLDEGQGRLRSRMEVRNSPSALSPLLADTGLFFGSRQQLVVPEFAAVYGPFSFQSEAYTAWYQGVVTQTPAGLPLAPQGTVFFFSWYAEAHYFLTGEHREYNRESAAFGRVIPRTLFDWTRAGFTGLGAWQVAARYSYMDLNSKGVTGGRVHAMTAGLNWFMNPDLKVQWNYSLAYRAAPGDAPSGLIHAFGTRVAIDF
ncbi:MAG: porin [Gemmataceae bacterium]